MTKTPLGNGTGCPIFAQSHRAKVGHRAGRDPLSSTQVFA
jgi:hypothetical protein